MTCQRGTSPRLRANDDLWDRPSGTDWDNAAGFRCGDWPQSGCDAVALQHELGVGGLDTLALCM